MEYLFPYEHPREAIADRLKRNGLTQALFNLPPGNWAAGERGLAALPDRFDELRDGVATALTYAAATGVKRVHLMAGNADATIRKRLPRTARPSPGRRSRSARRASTCCLSRSTAATCRAISSTTSRSPKA